MSGGGGGGKGEGQESVTNEIRENGKGNSALSLPITQSYYKSVDIFYNLLNAVCLQVKLLQFDVFRFIPRSD